MPRHRRGVILRACGTPPTRPANRTASLATPATARNCDINAEVPISSHDIARTLRPYHLTARVDGSGGAEPDHRQAIEPPSHHRQHCIIAAGDHANTILSAMALAVFFHDGFIDT